MATSINFPVAPSVDDTYTYGNTTYVWNGTVWYPQYGENTLSALTDTELSSVVSGDTLFYSGGTWLPTSGNTVDLTGYSPTGHTHTEYSPTGHTHTEYSPTGHTHTESDITDLQDYSLTGHTHTLSALTDTELSAVTDGSVIIYNSGTTKWEAGEIVSGVAPDSVGLVELKDELKSIGSVTTGVANGFGEQIYTTPGTYTFTATTNSISVVCIGGGGGGDVYSSYSSGGGGGGLGWKNNIPVVSGNTYTVVVGAGGTKDNSTATSSNATDGGDSYFSANTFVLGGGGPRGRYNFAQTTGGLFSGDSGGEGGYATGTGTSTANSKGGGGAGGYSGNGGNTHATTGNSDPGTGGGGGAGGNSGPSDTSGDGGGVGLFGEGASGAGGTYTGVDATAGGGGSGGADGGVYNSTGGGYNGTAIGAYGGQYGGGGGGSDASIVGETGDGGDGAVRIIWGIGAEFPSSATTSGATNIIEIDWNDGVQFEYTLTGATYLIFANPITSKTIVLVTTGNYTLNFPIGVDISELASYDGTKRNVFYITCISTSLPLYSVTSKVYTI